MGSITIQDHRLAGATLLPDSFVDYYMPRANGEFVKIFLYLLRSVHASRAYPTLSSLADVFSCTEKDILRALRYWEKAGLLKLDFQDKELAGITLLPISETLSATRHVPEETEKEVAPAARENPAAPAVAPDADVPPVTQISSVRLRELKNNEDAKTIAMVAETYLGRTLGTSELRHLLYFYDELHFPENLVEYLVEYCVSRGKRSMHYIETVGLAWYREGILTLKEAKAREKVGKKNYYTIFRAFGIRNRDPIPDETMAMDRWMNEFGFSTDIIGEAASRTIRKTGQPSFPYADSILTAWHSAGVKTMEDIAVLDRQYQSAHKGQENEGKKSSASSRPGNRFNNNFQSRTYDYDKLEQDLLNSQKSDPK